MESDGMLADTAPVAGRRRRCCSLVYLYAGCVSLASFSFGYSVTVISGVLTYLKSPYYPAGSSLQLTSRQGEVLASLIMLGALLGAAVAGPLFDSLGRRSALVLAAVFYIIGTAIQTVAFSYAMLCIGRGVMGIAGGISMLIAPTFIAELSPKHMRGAMVNFHELNISVGACCAFATSVIFSLEIFGGPKLGWRWMVGFQIIPALLLLFSCIFILPQSPRYLVATGIPGNSRKAESVISSLSEDPAVVRETLADIKEIVAAESMDSWGALFTSTRNRRLLGIGVLLGMFQQVVGVDSLMMYTPNILKDAGFVERVEDGLPGVLALGLTKMLTEVVVILIIDHVGRRGMLLVGATLVLICNIGLASLLYMQVGPVVVFVLTLVYVCAFAFSWGPVLWILVSEMFPLGIRGRAAGIVVVANRSVSFLVAHTFLSAASVAGSFGFPFLIYACLAALALAFAWYYVPETKGVPLEKVPALFWKADN